MQVERMLLPRFCVCASRNFLNSHVTPPIAGPGQLLLLSRASEPVGVYWVHCRFANNYITAGPAGCMYCTQKVPAHCILAPQPIAQSTQGFNSTNALDWLHPFTPSWQAGANQLGRWSSQSVKQSTVALQQGHQGTPNQGPEAFQAGHACVAWSQSKSAGRRAPLTRCSCRATGRRSGPSQRRRRGRRRPPPRPSGG